MTEKENKLKALKNLKSILEQMIWIAEQQNNIEEIDELLDNLAKVMEEIKDLENEIS